MKTMIIISCILSAMACSSTDSHLEEQLVQAKDNQHEHRRCFDLDHLTQAWAYYGDKDVKSPIILIPRTSYTKYSQFNFSLKKGKNFNYTCWGIGPWTAYGSKWSVAENKENEFILNLRFAPLEKVPGKLYRHRTFKILTLNQDKLVLEEINL